ncbi:unnamed protein product [Paramecium pentaurelia]|uniref:Uncharacterized protein n=1 Tax=Paramecium pentaurelia TaxID=43138 RepID=A0A8S1V3X2_9CILI|nr:unnamed protein product [Paramecium pentaurelia]
MMTPPVPMFDSKLENLSKPRTVPIKGKISLSCQMKQQKVCEIMHISFCFSKNCDLLSADVSKQKILTFKFNKLEDQILSNEALDVPMIENLVRRARWIYSVKVFLPQIPAQQKLTQGQVKKPKRNKSSIEIVRMPHILNNVKFYLFQLL